MESDGVNISGETTLEALLEDVPQARETLVKYFGPGVLMPGQTWMSEPISHACVIRGVDEHTFLRDLRKALQTAS